MYIYRYTHYHVCMTCSDPRKMCFRGPLRASGRVPLGQAACAHRSAGRPRALKPQPASKRGAERLSLAPPVKQGTDRTSIPPTLLAKPSHLQIVTPSTIIRNYGHYKGAPDPSPTADRCGVTREREEQAPTTDIRRGTITEPTDPASTTDNSCGQITRLVPTLTTGIRCGTFTRTDPQGEHPCDASTLAQPTQGSNQSLLWTLWPMAKPMGLGYVS